MNNLKGIVKDEFAKEYFRAVSKLMNFRELTNNIFILSHTRLSKPVYDIYFDNISLIVVYYPLENNIILFSNTDDELDKDMNYCINETKKIIFKNQIINTVSLIMVLFRMSKNNVMSIDKNTNLYTIKL